MAALGTENNLSSLNGNFKKQFADSVVELIPDHVILQKGMVDWVPSDKENGEFYAIPTLLRSNQGVSYLGESGAAQSLSSAKPGQMKEAQVYGTEIVVRGQLSYKALSQAAKAGPQAFKKSAAWLVEDLAQVAHTRIEIAALYGRSGLGVVSTVTDASAGVSADIVITDDSWAPGMWVLLEGGTLDSFTGTTKNNSNGALTIVSVTTSTKTVRVTYGGGTLSTEIAANDVLFFEGSNLGSGSYNEMSGLYLQFTEASAALFNITRATYSLIQPNTCPNTGNISKAKILEAAMLAVDKGCMTQLTVMVGTKAWAALAAEDMALRMFDSSYSAAKSKSGSRELEYESVNGTIKVVCHPLVKQSHGFIFNPDDTLWVGSSQPTFNIAGMPGEEYFRLVDGYNAVELQNYSDCAIYHTKPCQAVMMTGITYT